MKKAADRAALFMHEDAGRCRAPRVVTLFATLLVGILVPGTSHAYDSYNLLFAWGLLAAAPLIPLFFLLRRRSFVILGAALVLVWVAAIFATAYEDQIDRVLGLSFRSGIYSMVIVVLPFPIWFVALVLAAVNRRKTPKAQLDA